MGTEEGALQFDADDAVLFIIGMAEDLALPVFVAVVDVVVEDDDDEGDVAVSTEGV